METRGKEEGEGARGESDDDDPRGCQHIRKDAAPAQCGGAQAPLRILKPKKWTKLLALLPGRANSIIAQYHGTILQSDSSRE